MCAREPKYGWVRWRTGRTSRHRQRASSRVRWRWRPPRLTSRHAPLPAPAIRVGTVAGFPGMTFSWRGGVGPGVEGSPLVASATPGSGRPASRCGTTVAGGHAAQHARRSKHLGSPPGGVACHEHHRGKRQRRRRRCVGVNRQCRLLRRCCHSCRTGAHPGHRLHLTGSACP